ncbi:MAG: hypothetical protein GXP01_06880, partial [Alphaproteobacteria bacterium]|nr:hypothetical protein [Alphaproteobacteria bacterium]
IRLLGDIDFNVSDLSLAGDWAMTPIGDGAGNGFVTEATGRINVGLGGTWTAPDATLDLGQMIDAIKVLALEEELVRLERLRAEAEARAREAAAERVRRIEAEILHRAEAEAAAREAAAEAARIEAEKQAAEEALRLEAERLAAEEAALAEAPVPPVQPAPPLDLLPVLPGDPNQPIVLFPDDFFPPPQ